ncbi:hypothetical protein HUU05_14455 [candidate division KSB1 bacterium]|nr:hypothetical protein [candidate division KSB1 bacterium]
MNTNFQRLESQLALSLKAWKRSQWQRGLSLALSGFLMLAAYVYLIEPAWPWLWWSGLVLGGSAWLYAMAKYLLVPLLRQPTLTQVARYFEEHHPDLEDRLATALEVGQKEPDRLDPKMLERLFRDAVQHTQQIDFADQLRLQLAQLWRVVLYTAAAILLIGVFGFSGLFRTRLASYFTNRPAALSVAKRLQVQPGNAHVARGANVEVLAESPEVTASEATIYIAKTGASWQSSNMSVTTQPGKFTHHIFEVRDTTRYYVRLGGEISEIFALVPLDAPDLKQLRVTYRYPKKIGLPERQEESSGDIYAPIGTDIDLEAIATQALTTAEWRLGETEFQAMTLLADTLARASFKVEKDSYYVLRLTNRDGLSNTPVEYYIHATPDEAPQLTIVQPGRDLRPTMLEEVPITIAVFEDYGLQELTLVTSQNNGAEVRHDLLPAITRNRPANANRTEYRSEKLLYLEELGVQPGDFISYFVEARDAQQKASSDLYFLEVRPFEEEFYRSLSQGGGGGENADGMSLSQKEIITATWKLEQSRGKISPEELQKSSAAIAETQESLRESIKNMADHARMRGNFTSEGDAGNLVQYLEQAADAMAEAVPFLENVKPGAALDPERRAYHFLLQAEAEIRRRELTQGGGGASSFAQLQSQEDLARLFKEELDKLQSKYETLQNNQQQQREAQLNEAQEKVRELAQRQERLVDLNRQIAREKQAPEEQRRQLERLQREQEQIQRELQNLSRQMPPNNSAGSAAGSSQSQQLQENLQEIAQDLQRAQDQLRRNNPANAAAEGNRALERLQRLEEQLKQRQASSLRENLAGLHDEFNELAGQQSQLQRELEQAGNETSANERQRWQQAQEELRKQSTQALEQLQQAQTGASRNSEDQKTARELRKLAEELEKRGIPQRMAQAGQALEQNQIARAQNEQAEATQGLQRAAKGLQESLTQLAESSEEKLDMALQETQRLRQRLEEAWQQAQNSGQQNEGQQPASGQPNATGQSQSGTQANPQQGAPQSGAPSQEKLHPDKIDWWNERMWENAKQLENLRSLVESDSLLEGEYNDMMAGYRGVLRSFRGGDPQRLTNIENALLDPLRRFEAELAARVAVLQQQERLLNVRDERVPPQYREMVEAYFKKLAQSKKQ